MLFVRATKWPPDWRAATCRGSGVSPDWRAAGGTPAPRQTATILKRTEHQREKRSRVGQDPFAHGVAGSTPVGFHRNESRFDSTLRGDIAGRRAIASDRLAFVRSFGDNRGCILIEL
jgi:hypothetical protein